MGLCCFKSKSSAIPEQRCQKDGIESKMMSEMEQLHHRQVAKQQQMIHDDPECKTLMNRYVNLQKREFEASLFRDSDAYMQAQLEIHHLMKNPKMISLIMPDTKCMGMPSSSGTFGSHGAFGMPNPFSSPEGKITLKRKSNI